MQVLVIIVSATLTLFLIIAIVLLVMAIKLVSSIKRITDKAEHVVDQAEVVGAMLGKAAGPVAIGRLVTNLADTVFKHNAKGKKKE